MHQEPLEERALTTGKTSFDRNMALRLHPPLLASKILDHNCCNQMAITLKLPSVTEKAFPDFNSLGMAVYGQQEDHQSPAAETANLSAKGAKPQNLLLHSIPFHLRAEVPS